MFDKKTYWISPRAEKAQSAGYMNTAQTRAHIYARRRLFLSRKVKSAYILISADDAYRLYINGEYVCEGPDACFPALQTVDRADIGRFLHRGRNVFALDVFYNGSKSDKFVSGDGLTGFICEVHVNGRTVLRSDTRFKTLYVPCAPDDQAAETYDTHVLKTDFMLPEENDGAYAKSALNRGAPYRYRSGCELQKVFEPLRAEALENGVYDFGQEVDAPLEINAGGPDGAEIRLFAGREAAENDAPAVADARIILNGRNVRISTALPLRTRFVRAECSEGVQITEISARVRRYVYDENRFAVCDGDEAYAKLTEAAREELQRRLLPERGDRAALFLRAHAILNGEMRPLRTFLMDWAETSAASKLLLSRFPCSEQIFDAECSLAFPREALAYCKLTDDKSTLDECRRVSESLLDALGAYAGQDGLLTDVPGREAAGRESFINAMYICALQDYAELCACAGVKCEKQTDALKAAFESAFYSPEDKTFKTTDTDDAPDLRAGVYALAGGFANPDSVDEICARLPDEAQADAVDAYISCKALAHAGKREKLLQLLSSEELPSEVKTLLLAEEVLQLQNAVIGERWTPLLQADGPDASFSFHIGDTLVRIKRQNGDLSLTKTRAV
ncbi:MAG: hypothetical protein IKR85_08335 [Clostridia bacterium]|nr:hypothetical protein [Clostridia bacterium]